MKLRTLIASIAVAAILAGCAVGNDRLKNMTTSQVAALITDHQTTQSDLVKELGSPNNMHQEADGTKVLEYTWLRQRPSAKNFIPLNMVKEFPTTKKSLQVWVDDAGVVQKHELSGVFYVFRQPLIGADSTHSMRPLTAEELDDLVDAVEEAAADTTTAPETK